MIGLDERLTPTRTPLVPARVRALARTLRAGATGLRALPLEARIAAIDRLAAAWLPADSPWRARARAELAMSTGHPAPVIDAALDHLWHALRAPELAAAVRGELADADLRRLPDVALHVLAGNVPGVGVFGIAAALLAGVPSLVKPAAREPFLPALLVESIAALAPELRPAIAVAPWRGGSEALDAAAFGAVDLVLAYGRDETLSRIAARKPARLLRHGDRTSIALVARAALGPRTARALAYQTALYDQQGCLSPRVVFVEDADRRDVDLFSALVAAELGVLEHELPRIPPELGARASVWRWLERERWRAQEGADVSVHGGRDGAGSVVCDRTPDWSTGPSFRHLVLIPVATLAGAAEPLRRLAGTIEAVGYAGPVESLAEAAAVAAAAGAHRFCPLERLQAPPFAWRQSGHRRLASFLAHDDAVAPALPFA
ncbi:MAG: hypothetical protein IT293_06915 [Deltaproteobacteria bacterium]|nr:hypothetical protein [Deltaproteobacteria bacterium]